jgi:hypothetical protein
VIVCAWTRTHECEFANASVAGWGSPHFASVVLGTLAQVEEETTDLDAARDALAQARARLAEVPAEVVVTNHVMGLYELAAIHLSTDPPDLDASALAIDAVACLVDGLGDRLGEEAATLRDALANIRLAFVQIKGTAGSEASG